MSAPHSFRSKRALLRHLIEWHVLNVTANSADISMAYLRDLHRARHP
jgi:hypothetical protein